MFKNTIIFVKFLVVVVILSSNSLLAEEGTAGKTKIYLLEQKLLLTPPKKIEKIRIF